MIGTRLSVMMFLQYAVWGAWLPVAARYILSDPGDGGLGFSGAELGAILGLGGALGAITAPFVGQFADRHFRTERVLAVLLVLGGCIKWYTAAQTSYEAWLWLSIVYSILFMPTLALSNSLAMAHMDDRERQFPLVRVWGTIGWIAASWAFAMFWLQDDLKLAAYPPFLVGQEVEGVISRLVDALRFSGIIAFVYAAYCLTLPATPPRKEGVEPLAVAKAFKLLRHRSFLVIFLASLPIAMIHQIYFILTPNFLPSVGLEDRWIGPAMTVGQFSEILVMAGLGFMLKRIGFRAVLFMGAAAYFLRYLIWSFPELGLPTMIASQFLHGFCYACFFAASYIYVDKLAPADVRHSAQTVYGMLIIGIGPIFGGYLAGHLLKTFTKNEVIDFAGLWMTLAIIGLATAIATVLFFKDETKGKNDLAKHDEEVAVSPEGVA